MERETIATQMRALGALGSRISLIERSLFGEFSWPFASIIEGVADRLFVESSVDKDGNPIDLTPIVHVVAEGADYQIVDDEVPPPGERSIIIVAFPRQLKHQVLLHAIFGHELGHTAINAERTGRQIAISVIPKACQGPLQNATQANSWIKRPDAPRGVRDAIEAGEDIQIQEQALVNWRQEIICDLFGLRLFGPAFAAAHRAIIEPLCPGHDYFDPESTTHPPYPVRQRVLATAIKLLNWDEPVSLSDGSPLHASECALIAYITESSNEPWFSIFNDAQVSELLGGIEQVLDPYSLSYSPPSREDLHELVRRLAHERPPISQSLDTRGQPTNREIEGMHCLYAGWCYWFGRSQLTDEARKNEATVQQLSFLELNRLCDQALLQQRAIQLVNQAS
jgi:hypothetical protein